MTGGLSGSRLLQQSRVAQAWQSFALFSGGHDSLVSTHYAMSRGLASEVVHVNTGIGIEQTREFVRETCAEHRWTLNEVHPPVSYDEIVVAEGFPGPGAHFFMYVRLKERALAAFARGRKTKRGESLTFITGVRRDESIRRTAHVSERQDAPKQGWSWYAPLWDWSKADCNAYIVQHELRRNQVADILHMSGECLCGAFAKPGERNEIRAWFPETDARIAALEARVTAAGRHGDVWGFRPPNVHPDQIRMDGAKLCASCVSSATSDRVPAVATEPLPAGGGVGEHGTEEEAGGNEVARSGGDSE